jgi:hypothetical protein
MNAAISAARTGRPMSLASFPESARKRAARTWTFRAGAEAWASARFVQLARDLEAHQAPDVVVQMAHKAAVEEAEHIQLCLTLARAFGATPDELAMPHIASPPVSDTSHITLLMQVVGACCINETISAAVLNHMLRASEPGIVHDTIQQILRDEIGHSRIGWAYLAHMAEQFDVRPLGAMMPQLLAAAITDELFDMPEDADEDDPVTRLGVVPHAARTALFTASVNDLVLPGISTFQVDPEPAAQWLKQQSLQQASD